MNDQDAKQAQYLEDFKTFSPAKKRRHLSLIVRHVVNMIGEQQARPGHPLDNPTTVATGQGRD